MSLLDERDLLSFKKYFQFRKGELSEEDIEMLNERILKNTKSKVALGGSFQQKRALFEYGFYDKLIPEPHSYIQNLINVIEDEEKKDFERSRPPGSTNKPLRRRLTNIILSFMAAYYQSDRKNWVNDKRINDMDLNGIAGACRAQIILANRIAINRARNIFQAAKKFFQVAQRHKQNDEGYTAESLSAVNTIDLIMKDLRAVMIEQRSHFGAIQPQHRQRTELSEDDDEDSDDNDEVQKKQMSYNELVRNFSMHSEKIQKAYFEARRKLEDGFDYNQFVKVRNCLAYQFLLANSARSEVVTYLQWKEVEQARKVAIEKDPEDDFIMVPFYDHKNRGRGIHAKKPLFLGMDRWMLFDLTFLRGFCRPGNKFVFPSGKANKERCTKGMNASRVTAMMAAISGVEYNDHLHWIRSSATNASCISTEQSTSQMMPDMELVILNGHSMQTAQKHYMRLPENERCLMAARAYVKLSKKRRTAFDEVRE